MAHILTKKFFDRPTIKVAHELLGKALVRRYGKRKISAVITEVEAYDGHSDRASHASRGETSRNKVMFGEAGRFYVYFTYGMHWLVNIVTGPRGYPAAILLRSGKLKTENGKYKDIVGPARLTKYLKIDGKLNGKIAGQSAGLWFENKGIKIKPSKIARRKRVGVDYAGKWADKLYNFSTQEIG